MVTLYNFFFPFLIRLKIWHTEQKKNKVYVKKWPFPNILNVISFKSEFLFYPSPRRVPQIVYYKFKLTSFVWPPAVGLQWWN